ncbi:hypothetical protein [Arthrobacter sp. TE12232]
MKRLLGVALSVIALSCIVAVVLVLTGVWSPPWSAAAKEDAPRQDPGAVAVSQGHDVTLPSSDGSPEVRIPAAAFAGDGRLEVKPVELPEQRHGWSIGLTGARLTGQATLVFKNAVIDGTPPPLVGFNERPGDPIQYVLDTEVSGHDLVVHTTHFSNWVTDGWNWVTDWARGQLDRIYKDTGAGSQPQCDREAEARAGNVSVSSDSGGRVQWCLGKAPDGSTVLKVNNSRGYAVAAERTPGLTIGTRSLDFGQMVPRLARYITAPSKPGNTIDIIGPGETVEYKVDPASGPKGVRLEPSPPAYLATALWFGIQTTTMVYTKVLGKISMETVSTAVDAADCIAGFQGMATADVSDARTAANYLNGAMGTVMSCMGKVFMSLAKGKLLDVVAVTIASVFTWVWSGIQTAANGLAAAADTALNLNGYTIVVTYPAAPAAKPSPIPGFPATLSGKWCTRAGPPDCFSDAETKAKYPDVRVSDQHPADGATGAAGAAGATDFHLCFQMDLGDTCSMASSMFLRYYPAGVEWHCAKEAAAGIYHFPACDPDYTSAHDVSQPRLVRLPNHQQNDNYFDTPPMYRVK